MAEWLRNGDFENLSWRLNEYSDNCGVWEEYPFVDDETGIIPSWDEVIGFIPSYEYLKNENYNVIAIADVAVKQKGYIHFVIEIVHSHPVPQNKLEFYRDNHILCYQISAEWIMRQIERPKRLLFLEN